MEAGRAVTRDDLEYVMDAVDVVLETGDAGCIHTGWGRFFMADNDKYVAGEPGSELGAAEWLNSQDGLAIACDNMAVEVLPGTDRPKKS